MNMPVFVLLLALLTAVVTSQDIQACLEAGIALAANQPCRNAVDDINDSLNGNTTEINRDDLNAYCEPDCRALNNRVLRACTAPGPLTNVDITEFICTTDGSVSCLEFLRSPQFLSAQETFEESLNSSCQADAQTCSPSCATAVQNYLHVGGCCLSESLNFASQFLPAADTQIIEATLSACPSVSRPENTCQVIGETTNSEPTDEPTDLQACIEAGRALAANQPCRNAVQGIDNSFQRNSQINREQLNEYCEPDCRALNNRILRSCTPPGGPLTTVDVTEFICTTNGSVSCLEILRSPQFLSAQETFEVSLNSSCQADAQSCSPSCATAVQTYLDAGGCCLSETLNFASQFLPAADIQIIEATLSACPSVNRAEGTCQVIGEMTDSEPTSEPTDVEPTDIGATTAADGPTDSTSTNGDRPTDSGTTDSSGVNGVLASTSAILIAAIMMTVI